MTKPSLSIPEWMAVAVIIAFMVLMSFIALLPEPPRTSTGRAHYLYDNFVEVTITGAVSKPGPYRLAKGSTVGDLLAEASPLPNADLRRVRPTTKLRRNHHVKVPVKKNTKN